MEDAKKFKDILVDYFSSTRKTSWGKNELTKIIRDKWTDFLENTYIKGGKKDEDM